MNNTTEPVQQIGDNSEVKESPFVIITQLTHYIMYSVHNVIDHVSLSNR